MWEEAETNTVHVCCNKAPFINLHKQNLWLSLKAISGSGIETQQTKPPIMSVSLFFVGHVLMGMEPDLNNETL